MKRLNKQVIIMMMALLISLLFVSCKGDESQAAVDTENQETQETQEESSEDLEEVIVVEDDTENEPPVDESVEVEIEEPEPEPEPEPIGPNSHLTGLPIRQEAYDRRPIGVMISNIEDALPQYGISDADILYEVMVEGGITRLFALFQDFETEKIGPVRSSRHYFLDLALEHDAIYTHVGQSVYAKAAFNQLDVDRFYGISYLDLILTFQDEERKRPHSTFTGYDYLMNTWDELNYRQEADYSDLKFTFNEEENLLEAGQVANRISLDYSGMYPTNPYLIYNEEDGLYYRYEFEAKHMDAGNGEQLKFKNIIVQYATTWWIKDDPNGCIDMTLITSGEGLYLTNGKVVPITWSKENHYAPTYYFYEDGSPLVLNKGKTFISIYPKHRIENIVLE